MPTAPSSGSKAYSVTAQLATSPLRVDVEDLLLRHVLDEVAQAQDDDLVRDDEHALAGIVERDGVERAAQPKDHVAPALPAGRAVVELAQKAP